MADSTIANLTDGTTADATDRIPVERSPFGAGTNRYITPAYLATLLGIGGLTSTRVPVMGGSGALVDYANLAYSETSGPRLQVGSGSTTSAGWKIGYGGSSGLSSMWSTAIGTPDGTNSALAANSTSTYLGAASTIRVYANGSQKSEWVATAGSGLSITAGTATTDVQALSATQTWNAAGVAFTGIKYTITNTASAAGSLAMQILGGAAGSTNLISVDKNGAISAASSISSTNGDLLVLGAGKNLWFNTANPGSIVMGSSADLYINRGGANQVVFAGGAGTTTARSEINKAVTAFTDGVAKTVFTLTIPNAAHSATYEITVCGSIGAGGAVGANEASATNKYQVTIARTAGVNAVAGISAAYGASTAVVAGATTVTCTAALAAVVGAVGATNTIDIQATITKGGGASANHTCVAHAVLLNANATGVTIA